MLILPFSWRIIEVNSKGELTITNKIGHQFKPILRENCYINEYLTILNFVQPNFSLTKPPIVLLNIQHEEMRKLRVWLRWFNHQQAINLLPDA